MKMWFMCEWTMAFAMVCKAKILFHPPQLDSSEGVFYNSSMDYVETFAYEDMAKREKHKSH